MSRLSKGLILHGIRTYNGTEEVELHVFGSQGKQKDGSVTSMAERKSGSGTSAIWQSWQSGVRKRNFTFWQLKQSVSGEAEFQIFDSQGRAEVRNRDFTSLEVPAEMKCGSGPSHLWKSWSKKSGSGTRFFEVLAEQKFGKPNFTSSPMKAVQKCADL